MKTLMQSVVLAAGLFASGIALAGEPAAPWNAKDGVAVRGYDVTAYFTESRAVRGLEQFEYQWMGVKWRFASKQNRDTFAAAPDMYAPQFGGYCSWAVGHNYTADADPEAWRIVDGKLYLNYNRPVQKRWDEDRAKWIEDGRRNWPGLHK
ncbi:MAG: hypothetical protein IT161_12685 [Bryobacterales bacterium]|nr:hypothetical protein [Bryobacterales bacterium]